VGGGDGREARLGVENLQRVDLGDRVVVPARTESSRPAEDEAGVLEQTRWRGVRQRQLGLGPRSHQLRTGAAEVRSRRSAPGGAVGEAVDLLVAADDVGPAARAGLEATHTGE